MRTAKVPWTPSHPLERVKTTLIQAISKLAVGSKYTWKRFWLRKWVSSLEMCMQLCKIDGDIHTALEFAILNLVSEPKLQDSVKRNCVRMNSDKMSDQWTEQLNQLAVVTVLILFVQS